MSIKHNYDGFWVDQLRVTALVESHEGEIQSLEFDFDADGVETSELEFIPDEELRSKLHIGASPVKDLCIAFKEDGINWLLYFEKSDDDAFANVADSLPHPLELAGSYKRYCITSFDVRLKYYGEDGYHASAAEYSCKTDPCLIFAEAELAVDNVRTVKHSVNLVSYLHAVFNESHVVEDLVLSNPEIRRR